MVNLVLKIGLQVVKRIFWILRDSLSKIENLKIVQWIILMAVDGNFLHIKKYFAEGKIMIGMQH